MWAILGKILKEVLVGFYKEWRARRDVTLLERQRAGLEAAKRAINALEFEAKAAADPDRGGKLRVRRGGGTIDV
ncbi:MAG: hypothetical protein ACE5JQ_17290 [Candidatus Methylomirabilales bacterium]